MHLFFNIQYQFLRNMYFCFQLHFKYLSIEPTQGHSMICLPDCGRVQLQDLRGALPLLHLNPSEG